MIWGFAGISGSFLVAVFSVNQLHAAVPVYRLAFSQRAPRNARPHEAGGGRTVRLHWFHSGIRVLHGRACFPRRSHLRLDDQHAAQSPCLAILVPLGMWRLIDNKRHRGSGGWPHPLPAFYRPRSRSDAPVTSRYTRSVAIHPIRRGAMPTDRVHRLPQQARSRAIPPHRPQPSTSDAATRPRHAHPGSEREALHPLRRDTPDPSRCTRSEGVQCLRIGCAASHNKHNRGQFLPTDPNRQHRTPPHGLDMLTPAPNERRCTS